MENDLKETITDMLDEEYSPPDDANAEWRAHESTPFVKPTTTKHKINISEERWNEIFGHD